MVLGEYVDSLFSNDDQDEPASMSFPQGQQFNTLQHGKIMRHQARADRLIDPNGFSVEHTLYGQRALGGKSINTETNVSVIEGFDTKANVQEVHTAIAGKNVDDKETRLSLSNTGAAASTQYLSAIDNLVVASKDFANQPISSTGPFNAFLAQSVPNPISSKGSTAIGKDYIPEHKSGGLGNAAPAHGTAGITCAGSDMKGCVTMCQARTFDEGGVGFTLTQGVDQKNPHFDCNPILLESDLDKLKAEVAGTPQNMSRPGGSWYQSATDFKMKGDVLVAKLKDENGVTRHQRIKITDPHATYSNINGVFRQDLNHESGLGAITIKTPPPGLKSTSMEDNILMMTTNDGVTYSTEVEAGDVVEFKPGTAEVSCSHDAQCAAAGLPTWINGVSRPGAFHCPGVNDKCYDPSTGKYAKIGKLVTTKKTVTAPGPQLEQNVYSVNYAVKGDGAPGAHAKINKAELGTIHYVDAEGQVQLGGGTDFDWNTQSYSHIGNFRTDFATASNKAATPSACQTSCNESNSCRGYVFTKAGLDPVTGKSVTASCHLMGESDWPHGGRLYDKNSNMLLRLPELTKAAQGCPTTTLVDSVTSIAGKKQIDPPVEGCGIAAVMQQHEDKIDSKNRELMGAQSEIQSKMYGLLADETALQGKLSSSLDQMETDLSEYQDVNTKTQSVAQKLTQANAMSEDTKLQLVSENYHYLLWSILAITLVIGGIRASRN